METRIFSHVDGLRESIPGHIRYQLLHRTASAVIETKKFHCGTAVMIVQSFVGSDTENHFDDYAQSIQLYGATPEKDKLPFLRIIDGTKLYLAWVFFTFSLWGQKQHSELEKK